MLMQNVVFDQKFCFQVAINPLKINTNSAKFLNETFPSDEQNAPFPFLAEVFLSFQLISPFIFNKQRAGCSADEQKSTV